MSPDSCLEESSKFLACSEGRAGFASCFRSSLKDPGVLFIIFYLRISGSSGNDRNLCSRRGSSIISIRPEEFSIDHRSSSKINWDHEFWDFEFSERRGTEE